MARNFAPLILVYITFFVFNRESIGTLLTTWWHSHEASQGLILVPVSLWLTFKQLAARNSSSFQPSWPWVVCFGIA